jgi:hypothetical protein
VLFGKGSSSKLSSSNVATDGELRAVQARNSPSCAPQTSVRAAGNFGVDMNLSIFCIATAAQLAKRRIGRKFAGVDGKAMLAEPSP